MCVDRWMRHSLTLVTEIRSEPVVASGDVANIGRGEGKRHRKWEEHSSPT